MKIKLIMLTLALGCLTAQSPSSSEPTLCFAKFVGPKYPGMMRQTRIEGTVQVQVYVSSSGQPGEISIIGPANPVLAAASTNALKEWRFCPSVNAKSEARKIVITFVYKLENYQTDNWAPTDVVFEAPSTVTVSTASPNTHHI
jgi:TonB family protein